MVITGLILTAIFLMVYRTSKMLRSLWALGLSAVLFGIWSLCDTGMLQLVSGITYACREIVYMMPHLTVFPMIFFVNYFTRPRRRIYLYMAFAVSVLSFGWQFCSKSFLGADIGMMSGAIYFSFLSELVLMIILIVDNELVCRKKKVSSNLRHFYVGAGILITTAFIDIIRYAVGTKVSIGRGTWFRFGLILRPGMWTPWKTSWAIMRWTMWLAGVSYHDHQ